jgi:hypothetical protein
MAVGSVRAPRTELDGTAIRDTSRRALVLWPEEPVGEAGGSWRTSKITSWDT